MNCCIINFLCPISGRSGRCSHARCWVYGTPRADFISCAFVFDFMDCLLSSDPIFWGIYDFVALSRLLFWFFLLVSLHAACTDSLCVSVASGSVFSPFRLIFFPPLLSVLFFPSFLRKTPNFFFYPAFF